MATKKRKSSNINYGQFLQIPHVIYRSPEYQNISNSSAKLLLDLIAQWTGYNNGHLTCNWAYMRNKGWKSKETLHRAKKQLIEQDLVVQTRLGGKGMGCSLYAISWQPIVEGTMPLDVAINPNKPLKDFRISSSTKTGTK